MRHTEMKSVHKLLSVKLCLLNPIRKVQPVLAKKKLENISNASMTSEKCLLRALLIIMHYTLATKKESKKYFLVKKLGGTSESLWGGLERLTNSGMKEAFDWSFVGQPPEGLSFHKMKKIFNRLLE